MKPLLILLVYLGVVLSACGAVEVNVEVEQVLDAPPGRWSWFSGDHAAYAPNGKLIVANPNAFNVFMLEGEQWVPLIDEYRTEAYNLQQQQDRYWGVVRLFNSSIDGEFLYSVKIADVPAEHYRIFVDADGELQAKWVSKAYFEEYSLGYLLRGWSIEEGLGLKHDFRITLNPVEEAAQAYWPDLLNTEGNAVYRFTDGFRQGFVEDVLSITRNLAGDRVAMVIAFYPEEESPHQVRKMVIFRINYDQ
jgi:hypothetical protein